MPELPFIPETITVHLGRPDQAAQNVTVSFQDYIKNVASSEIYPTWPENAIRANILAQISYALNRVYTEFYPSRGYSFDITNSTAFDQSFVNGRDIFENISRIVDDIFDTYIYRQGSIEPLFAQYCNGTTVTCSGLSQWGTVPLAEQGLTPYEILQRYYGYDINLRRDAPVMTPNSSEPYRPLRPGDIGNDVRTVQLRLNRIAVNYPSIPKIYPVNGIYSASMEDSVREFQRIFDLAQDGIIGKGTWYKILQIYNGVKRLNELDSEGLALADVSKQFPTTLRKGDSGVYVRDFQYFLAVLAQNLDTIPEIAIDGSFGDATERAVIAFQRAYGLTPDGVVGEVTWNTLFNAYRGIVLSTPEYYTGVPVAPYPGYVLSLGMQNNEVRLLQEYLSAISEVYTEIPPVEVTGVYGAATRDAVIAAERLFGLNPDGQADLRLWNAVTDAYSDIVNSSYSAPGQFGGTTLSQGRTQ